MTLFLTMLINLLSFFFRRRSPTPTAPPPLKRHHRPRHLHPAPAPTLNLRETLRRRPRPHAAGPRGRVLRLPRDAPEQGPAPARARDVLPQWVVRDHGRGAGVVPGSAAEAAAAWGGVCRVPGEYGASGVKIVFSPGHF